MTAAFPRADEPDIWLRVLEEMRELVDAFVADDDTPLFGSPAWLDLPDDDERRATAIMRAALAWWRVGEPAEDLLERAAAAADVATSHDICAAMRRAGLIGTDGYRPSMAELRQLRRRTPTHQEVTAHLAYDSWAQTTHHNDETLVGRRDGEPEAQ